MAIAFNLCRIFNILEPEVLKNYLKSAFSTFWTFVANFKPLIGKKFCTFQSIHTQHASRYELVSPWYSVF
jgi:hypothetical protein